ncbi:MAG: helix-turn-helix transcriptional regulator [Acetivibrio sp.]
MVYDFGIRLKELRKDKHLSQSDAAKRLGITRSTVSAYECNTKTPSVEVLLQLAVLYNSSLDYMMGFENRSSIYLDDMTESQQKTILDIINRLKQEFNQNR